MLSPCLAKRQTENNIHLKRALLENWPVVAGYLHLKRALLENWPVIAGYRHLKRALLENWPVVAGYLSSGYCSISLSGL